ncbi:ParA family protein [bacterium]|nr:MAG: ParA family protein [bacterium]
MILAVYNGKGGIGKTLTAVNLAAIWSQTHRVLFIDLDAHYSGSSFLHAQDAPNGTSADVLMDGASVSSVAIPGVVGGKESENLRVVPAGEVMNEVVSRLPSLKAPEIRLSRALRHGVDWDVCVLDCSGHFDITTRNALLAATHLLLPVNSDRQAYDTAVDTIRHATDLRDEYERAPLDYRVLLTSAAHRTVNTRDIEQVCRETWPDKMCQTTIRYTEKLRGLSRYWATVVDEEAGTGREDYTALAKELWAWSQQP